MSGLLICAILVSVGSAVQENLEIDSIIDDPEATISPDIVDPIVEEEKIPAIYSILCSVLMPIVCTFQVLL